MKKDIGAGKLALYPTPAVVVGAMVDGKPNWLLVAHVGIVTHSKLMLSMFGKHFTNAGVRETGVLSVNVVDEALLPKADFVGSVSGAKQDKSDAFEWHVGENGAPVIDEAPLYMECRVEQTVEVDGFDNFVCSIDATCVEEEYLDEKGKVDYGKLKPVLFEMPGYTYLRCGERIGRCLKLDGE